MAEQPCGFDPVDMDPDVDLELCEEPARWLIEAGEVHGFGPHAMTSACDVHRDVCVAWVRRMTDIKPRVTLRAELKPAASLRDGAL